MTLKNHIIFYVNEKKKKQQSNECDKVIENTALED